LTLVTAGRVGKPHGLDGSFYVDGASHPLDVGAEVFLGERRHPVARRGGTDQRPLIRLEGLDDPASARGQVILVDVALDEEEWLAADLVGLMVPGRGRVTRVLDAPSCSVLELDDGSLIPFIADAIRSIEGGEIHVDEHFLG
jgi:16S rRNA processing protein RimM